MGAGWFHDFTLVATKNPNIFADFSGCLEYTPITEIITPLERLIQFIGADRILLGGDYPLFRLTTFIEIVRTLKLSDSEKRKILGENAVKIFHIS
jgi:predicted TIM-barrel fold metal-dependent hydrolase